MFDYNNTLHPEYSNNAMWHITLNASEVWLLRHLLTLIPGGTEAAGQAGFILHDLEQVPTISEFWPIGKDGMSDD